MESQMIYFDNNATTVMPTTIQKSMIRWCNMGNPSASYATAKEARKMMDSFRAYIGELCGFDACCSEPRDYEGDLKDLEKAQRDPTKYKVIFTSGASEANCTILLATVDAYTEIKQTIPHVVMSAVEHKSLLDMAKSMEERGRITLTLVKPTPTGHILPQMVSKAIKQNTCLVCVMHANNETGAINDIAEIGRLAHLKNVPFHSDTVQSFGKFPIRPYEMNVDSFCMSFHKFHGPPGVGALVVRQDFLQGYEMHPLIYGSQNNGLRGGTENLPGLGASFDALKFTMNGRDEKNRRMVMLKKRIMNGLATAFITMSYTEYLRSRVEKAIVFLSGGYGLEQNQNEQTEQTEQNYLPNTILLSVVKKLPPAICNGQIKKELEDKSIVVSVGSACNTASPKASHVLYAMGCDEYIRRGALRISLGDMNTVEEADAFVNAFTEVVNKQFE